MTTHIRLPLVVLFTGLMMMFLPGATFNLVKAVGSESQAAVTRHPSAHQNWFNYECIVYRKADPLPGFPLKAVVAEYANKVASRSSVPPMRVGNCRGVSGNHGHVQVVRSPRNATYCALWVPSGQTGHHKIKLNPRCQTPRGMLCAGVGKSIGAELYRRPFPGTAAGCLKRVTGPRTVSNHLSRSEARVIRRAWDRNPGD